MNLQFTQFLTMLATLLVILAAVHAGVMKYLIEPAISKTITKAIESVLLRVSKLELDHVELETTVKLKSDEGDRVHVALWESINEMRKGRR